MLIGAVPMNARVTAELPAAYIEIARWDYEEGEPMLNAILILGVLYLTFRFWSGGTATEQPATDC